MTVTERGVAKIKSFNIRNGEWRIFRERNTKICVCAEKAYGIFTECQIVFGKRRMLERGSIITKFCVAKIILILTLPQKSDTIII